MDSKVLDNLIESAQARLAALNQGVLLSGRGAAWANRLLLEVASEVEQLHSLGHQLQAENERLGTSAEQPGRLEPIDDRPFVGAIAQELNKTLALICFALDFLLEKTNDTECRACLGRIKALAQRADKLASDCAAFSKAQMGESEPNGPA
ncbi:MAG: hypothetical protein JNM27_16975 [Leptospirales bacterium]|nr:hypothetical protein [Leptospirales bacterium]